MLTRLPLRLARPRGPLCAWRHWTPQCPVPLNVPRSRWRWALPCCLASWLLPNATGAEQHDFGRDRRDRRDRRLVQCEERTVKLKSRSAGHGKQLVVLVHGLDSWSGTWQALMELLAKRGVPTLALDLRGHGESPLGRPEDFSPEQLAADVRAAVEVQGPGSRIALVGHSMGGRIAMQYAADYPEDLNLLVIEDMDCVPRSYPVLEGEKLKNCQHSSREFQSSESARKTLISFGYNADRVDGWFVGSPPRVYEKDGKIWSCINPFAQYLAKQTVLNSVQGQRSLQQIAAWKTSGANFAVHVCVAGSQGTVCSWDKLPGGIRDMESILPSLQVHEFPQAGHSIHNTELEKFADLLEILLQSCD